MKPFLGKKGIASFLLGVVFFLFAIVLVRTAWVCDDAYITFRTVENFITGYGLTWNVNERVQAYTHPLWMFVMAIGFFLTREIFFTSLFISIMVSLFAVALLVFKPPKTAPIGLFTMIVLLFSRAFIDYSTSGLENPMTHLLLALFCMHLYKEVGTEDTLFWLTFIAALGTINRMDTLLLFAPAIAYFFLNLRPKKALLQLLLGALPFLLWEVFSLLYYGFLFPNTAYAKLGAGIPASQLLEQGIYYLLNSWKRDPITLSTLGLAILVTLKQREKRTLLLLMGALLYVLYVIRVGGDFMSGRFLTPPFFVALLILTQTQGLETIRRWLWGPIFAVVILVGVLTPDVPLFSGKEYGDIKTNFKDEHGIGDERKFYYDTCGLLQFQHGLEMPTHEFAKMGRGYRQLNKTFVKVHGSVGFRGFFAGPYVHLVDYYALADPLLARLPAKYNPNWRIGHFTREIPEGYESTLREGKNKILNPKIAELYHCLTLITRGPLGSWDRWKAIFRIHFTEDFTDLVLIE
ncbi:MAG: hypothetical protein AABZ60_14395 [Planctomycetota bacterium]